MDNINTINDTQKTILLTGHAGFIGSQILRDLLELGHNVIGVDNMSIGSSCAWQEHPSTDFTHIEMDIASKDILDVFYEHTPDYVINCAAQSHVDRSWDSHEEFIRSNINGPINLAKFALACKCKRFVQVSTDEVFHYSNKEYKADENSTIGPTNFYASTKASAEMFLMNLHKAKGLPVVLTNGANTYGPRQYVEKIIPLTVSKLLAGERVPVYRTPAQRMWLHVEDHSKGIIAALFKGEPGQRYCLAPEGCNELWTMDLVFKIAEILHIPREKSIKFVDDRPNYDLRYYMSNQHAKRELDWYPTKNIVEELPAVVAGFLT